MRQDLLDRIAPQLQWLQNSRIQRVAGDSDVGAVHAWIDETSQQPAFLYSEISGYFMTLCAHLARHQPTSGWLIQAQAAAHWICEHAMEPSGAILARKYLGDDGGDPFSFARRQTLFFDAAMVGFGLLCTYELDGNDRWLQAAQQIGAFCRKHFVDGDTHAHAVYNLEAQKAEPAQERWSLHFGPFELKGVMFMKSLARHSGEQVYDDIAEWMLQRSLAQQHENGRFPTTLSGVATHLHPHNYTIEGLLFLAARESRAALLSPINKAVDWVFRTCLQPGRLLQQWSQNPDLVIHELRADVLAQSLRSYFALKLLDPSAHWPWEIHISSLLGVLDEFKLASGGTSYGQDEYGQKSQHANAWCHFFLVEMELYRSMYADPSGFDPQQLIIT